MKKILLAGGVAILLSSIIPLKTNALVRSRPGCNQVYQYLLSHMRECPTDAGGNCIPFSANLTRERGLTESGEEIFYCKLEGTSLYNLFLTRNQTGTLQGLGDGDPIEMGERIDLVDVEMRTDKYSHFVYDIRVNAEESVDLFNFRLLQLSYTERGAPLTKTVYFTQFRVDGVERSAEPVATPDPNEARCGFLADDSERHAACLINPAINSMNPGDGSDTECSEAVNGIRACYDANDDIICLNAQDAQVDCPPEFRPRTLDSLSGGGMGADEDDGQAAADSSEGLFCSLNTNASPKGFWFGFGGLMLVALALAGLRRNIK